MGEKNYLDPHRMNNRVRIDEGIKDEEIKGSSENKKLVFDPIRQNKLQADSIRRQIQESPNGGKDARAYLYNGVLYITDKPMRVKEFEDKGIKPITVEHALLQKEFGEGITLVQDLAGVEKPLDKGIDTSAIQQPSSEKSSSVWEMDSIPDHLVKYDTPSHNNNCSIYAMLGAVGHDMRSKEIKRVVDGTKTFLLNNKQIDLVRSESQMLEFSYYKTDAENMTRGSGEQAFLYLRDSGYIPEGHGLRVYDYQPYGAMVVRDPIDSDPGKEPICIYHQGVHFEALQDLGHSSCEQKEIPIPVNETAKVDSFVKPRLAELLPGITKGNNLEALTSLENARKQLVEREKKYLECGVSLNEIYENIESKYPEAIGKRVNGNDVAYAKWLRNFYDDINYQLSEKRFIDLITKMAPNGYEKKYEQAIKNYCKQFKLGEEHISRIVDALEANKNDACEWLFENRNNIEMSTALLDRKTLMQQEPISPYADGRNQFNLEMRNDRPLMGY